MKNPVLVLVFAFFVISFSSCEKEPDPIFQPLIGQFENSSTQESNEEYVIRYIFSANGVLEIDVFVKNSETGSLKHYVSYAKGNYRATESTITVDGYEFYHHPYFSTERVINKEDLQQGVVGSSTFEINYELRNSGNELFIPGSLTGGDMIMPDLSFTRI